MTDTLLPKNDEELDAKLAKLYHTANVFVLEDFIEEAREMLHQARLDTTHARIDELEGVHADDKGIYVTYTIGGRESKDERLKVLRGMLSTTKEKL